MDRPHPSMYVLLYAVHGSGIGVWMAQFISRGYILLHLHNPGTWECRPTKAREVTSESSQDYYSQLQRYTFPLDPPSGQFFRHYFFGISFLWCSRSLVYSCQDGLYCFVRLVFPIRCQLYLEVFFIFSSTLSTSPWL